MKNISDQEYLSKAKKIVEQYDLQKYIDKLLDYWEENPTTLGHGFDHVVKAAVDCFETAKLNNYPDPEELFIAGLLHDLYRPAEGKAGMEDHHDKTCQALAKVFGLGSYIQKLIKSLKRQKEWRGKNPDKMENYDLYYFIGERITHRSYMTNSYLWASNKYCKDNSLPLKYISHQTGLYHFIIYQVPIWQIFIKFPIKGVDRAMDTYIDVYTSAATNYQNDRNGKNFLEFLEKQAQVCRNKEILFLKAFNRDSHSIRKIMKEMY